MDKFKIEKPYGPKPLRKMLQLLADAINKRTPKDGFGTKVDVLADGFRINALDKAASSDAALVEDDGGSGTTSGTASDIYGSLNGQPAVFHLSQTADPELVT